MKNFNKFLLWNLLTCYPVHIIVSSNYSRYLQIFWSFGFEARSVFLDISNAFDKVWHWGFISKLKQNWCIPEIDDIGPCEDLGPRTLQRGPWSTTLRRSRTQDPMRGQDPGPCWENAKSRTLRGPRTHEPFERIQDSEPCYDVGPRIEPYWMDPGSKTRSRGPRTHRTVLRTRKFVERTVNF